MNKNGYIRALRPPPSFNPQNQGNGSFSQKDLDRREEKVKEAIKKYGPLIAASKGGTMTGYGSGKNK